MILCLHPDLLVLWPKIFSTSLFVDDRYMLNRQFPLHYLECSHTKGFFYVLVHIVTAGQEEEHTFKFDARVVIFVTRGAKNQQ